MFGWRFWVFEIPFGSLSQHGAHSAGPAGLLTETHTRAEVFEGLSLNLCLFFFRKK